MAGKSTTEMSHERKKQTVAGLIEMAGKNSLVAHTCWRRAQEIKVL